MRPRVITILFLLGCHAALFADSDTRKQAAGLQLAYLREAQEFFYLDYGLFTTIENLDDILAFTTNPDYDAINSNGGALVIVPGSGEIRRQILTSSPTSAGPPYLTRSSGQQFEGPSGDYDQGTLLDPWGNPYYFYSPLGLIEPKIDGISLRHYGDDFHVYALVSHGPDGQPRGGDDLIEYIYVPITTLAISSVRLRNAPAKSLGNIELQIRGYRFGSTQGTGDILINGQPSGLSATTWSDTLITASLSETPDLDSAVSVRTNGGATTRELAILDERQPSQAHTWEIYP